MKLEEAVCAAPIFKRMEGHKGTQGLVIKDMIRPDVYCASISEGPREFGLNKRGCTFEETPNRGTWKGGDGSL